MLAPIAVDHARVVADASNTEHATSDLPAPESLEAGEALGMRQLRHQTKNAWQRILWELSRAGGEECSLVAVRRLAALERRVCLAAEISDALFGFSQAPAPLAKRLQALGDGMAELLSGDDAQIRVDVDVHGECPRALHNTVVRVAHEMIGNALKHGLDGRPCGTITIRLFAEARQIRLVVADDGRGFTPGQAHGGQGTGLMEEMAAEHGGTVTLRRVGHLTAADMAIPLTVRDAAPARSRAHSRQNDARPDLRVI